MFREEIQSLIQFTIPTIPLANVESQPGHSKEGDLWPYENPSLGLLPAPTFF